MEAKVQFGNFARHCSTYLPTSNDHQYEDRNKDMQYICLLIRIKMFVEYTNRIEKAVHGLYVDLER